MTRHLGRASRERLGVAAATFSIALMLLALMAMYLVVSSLTRGDARSGASERGLRGYIAAAPPPINASSVNELAGLRAWVIALPERGYAVEVKEVLVIDREGKVSGRLEGFPVGYPCLAIASSELLGQYYLDEVNSTVGLLLLRALEGPYDALYSSPSWEEFLPCWKEGLEDSYDVSIEVGYEVVRGRCAEVGGNRLSCEALSALLIGPGEVEVDGKVVDLLEPAVLVIDSGYEVRKVG